MIFEETFEEARLEATEIVSYTLNKAKKNQKHNTDILLIAIHGFYDEFLAKVRKDFSPFVFGPGEYGLINGLNNSFLNTFISQIKPGSREKFIDYLKSNQKSVWYKEYFHSTQIELFIYMMIWESDFFLHKLINLSRLVSGKPYEWKINSRISRRIVIYDKIITFTKRRAPKLSEFIDSIYFHNIRNSVAHSQVILLDDVLHFKDDEDNTQKSVKKLTLKQWEGIFLKTITFYFETFKQLKEIEGYYRQLARGKHFGVKLNLYKDEKFIRSEWVRLIDPGTKRENWYWYKNFEKYNIPRITII